MRPDDGVNSWHGPYRIVELTNTGLTCVKVYYPQEGKLHVHQSRVCVCLQELDFTGTEGREKALNVHQSETIACCSLVLRTTPYHSAMGRQIRPTADRDLRTITLVPLTRREIVRHWQTLKVRPEQETTPRVFKRPQLEESWWIADQKNRSLL